MSECDEVAETLLATALRFAHRGECFRWVQTQMPESGWVVINNVADSLWHKQKAQKKPA